MEIGQEFAAEAGIGIGSVVVFIVALYLIGQVYATDGTLAPQGGLAIVAALGVFIVVLTAAGLWMERQEFDS